MKQKHLILDRLRRCWRQNLLVVADDQRKSKIQNNWSNKNLPDCIYRNIYEDRDRRSILNRIAQNS